MADGEISQGVNNDGADAVRDTIDKADAERLTQPVDTELPPRLPFPVVGIGASAGGLEAFTDFFKAMPADSGMAFVLVQHLPPDRESFIAEILGRHTTMPVRQVEDGMPVEANHVYVIRPGHTLTIREGKLHLGAPLDKPRHGRPVDDFFKSLAEEQRERAICIIMSGMGSNGTAGAQGIKAVGGLCIAQDLESAKFPSMPRHLIDSGFADFILPPVDMPEILQAYVTHSYVRDRESSHEVVQREQRHLREILALLRTRTRQDFAGYKKPTVMRRIQRRMGLNRITNFEDYVKVLRQSTVEVIALADDLLIHVTGFFRDPEVWDALRERVITPLIQSRRNDEPVRCWVTACSTGEEAYSLAMLLVEEMERWDKSMDIMVFATDTAERTLFSARAGIYPGGIEAEVSAARLERFFEKEDAVYRVRQDLRKLVVFAPQNVLQDPPFSRLDIVTCRNLLIYLEPEVQERVLNMLHFGLREGGTLFLGNSETVTHDAGMFELLDKKAKIYRRIGPTRHGTVQFPPPNSAGSKDALRSLENRGHRPSIGQLTNNALLSRHVPAAVTVDRDNRVLYFHGNTKPYLQQPTGEPTRDLLSLLGEGVRIAVRGALQKAMTDNAPATVLGGWQDSTEGRRRVIITASPLDSGPTAEFFVVSFDERMESQVSPEENHLRDGDNDLETQLRRARDELALTIEELQSSNEEHKASAEEVMSMNEELQSTNEELETSKEEMQSLNEELTTVNAQLQARIEDYQTISNDLGSLLSSTDIAVIFLDIHFRIRRYTPAANNLFEMIVADVGRPLKDLAKKFSDPALLSDAQVVLDKLVPAQREINTEDGRWYIRRILPYRTTNNRIEGVVLTFVEVSDIKAAQEALRVSETRLSRELMIMQRLHDVSMRAMGSRDLAGTLSNILQAVIDLDGADMGSVQVYDAATKSWRIVGHSGLESSFLDALNAISAEDVEASAQLLRRGPRVLGEDVTQAPEFAIYREVALKAGYRVMHSTPLMTLGNDMLGVLTTYFHKPHRASEDQLRVTDLYARLAADFIERLRAEETMTRLLHIEQIARASLDESGRLKEEFLATLSHELRTPLSAVLLWSKALRDIRMEPDEVKSGVDAIINSAESQARLIDDLLDTSRIASGKLHIDLVPTDLPEVVTQAVKAMRPAADAKGLSVELNINTDAVPVMGDAQRLHQVLWNLLSNAVKFTPAGGKISVTVVRLDGNVEVRVTDTGAGIDPGFLPLMFERFRQYDASKTRKQGGLGLGLAIAKQLVELHGGTIEGDSAGVGHGSTFVIRLPLRAAAPAAPAAPAAGAQGVSPLKGVKVLLVEDEPVAREAIVFILRKAGADVTPAGSAKEAIAAYGRTRPDVVVSDIGLPDVDGYAMLVALRKADEKGKLPQVPAMALTAYAQDQDRRQAALAGYQMHLAKPVEGENLIAAVVTMCAKR